MSRFRSYVKTLVSMGLLSFALQDSFAAQSDIPFFMGQHILYPQSYVEINSEMFSGVRIWGMDGTTWSKIEPADGRFDFSALDKHVSAATDKGLDITYTLGQTPTWASARPTERGNIGWGSAAEPADMKNWARYVREVVKRYRGRISSYEIMNEPRIPEAVRAWSPGFFSGSVETLAAMTKIAAEEIKSVDPIAMVICPSMDGSELGLRRLDRFLATGAGKYCDVIGFHYYLKTLQTNELRTLIRETKSLMAKYGLGNRPLWDTEIGVLISDAGNNLKPKERSGALSKMFQGAEAARFAAQVLIISNVLGVKRTYWFAHDSSWMGSTVADKSVHRLNVFGKSLALINRWLAGRTLSGCAETSAGLDCPVLAQGNWVGNVYWGEARTTSTWKSLGFKKIQFLNGDILDLSSCDGQLTVPSIPDEVMFVSR